MEKQKIVEYAQVVNGRWEFLWCEWYSEDGFDINEYREEKYDAAHDK